jgi:hypothetical protein
MSFEFLKFFCLINTPNSVKIHTDTRNNVYQICLEITPQYEDSTIIFGHKA